MASQAGPAFGRLVQAVQAHGLPAARRARVLIAGLASRSRAAAQDVLQRAQEQRRSRAAQPAAPRPGRAARRAWRAQLDALGRDHVEDMLERASSPHAGPFDVVRFVDAGITHGGNRYPTRQFVMDWLGDDHERADLGQWRAAAVAVMVVAAVSVGMLVFLI